jgi:ankyrin repeat protein
VSEEEQDAAIHYAFLAVVPFFRTALRTKPSSSSSSSSSSLPPSLLALKEALHTHPLSLRGFDERGDHSLAALCVDRRKEHAGAAAVLKLLKEEGGREVLERARGEGWTALHYAAQYQLSESAKVLVEEGREEGLEKRTRDEGNTPLGNLFEQIEGMNHPAAVATMRVLVEGGANLATINKEGNTLLHLALLRLLTLRGLHISSDTAGLTLGLRR